MKFNFIFKNPENKYRPIIVTLTPRPHEKISSLKVRAVQKVCAERHWTYDEMIFKYGYKSYEYKIYKED